MGNNFTVVKLSDITVKITKGTTPSQNDGGFAEKGINFIKAESVSYDGRINESTFAFIDESVHEKLKRSQLEENDILFSMAGAYLGKTGFVKKEHLPANINQALALIRVNESIANPKFIHYYLQQKSIIHFVNNSISQSAQPNINLQQIGDLNIILLHHSEQTKVVGFMSCLDNKITLNRQINQTLEQMAQALFKSWFVDFDPVVDNALDAGFFEQGLDLPDELLRRAEARKVVRAREGFKPLPAVTRQRFPAAFEPCAEPSLGLGGWVPKGWKSASLDTIANFQNGLALQNFRPDSEQDEYLPVLKIAQLRQGYCDDNERARIDIKESCRVYDGDMIFSWSGTLMIDIWTGGNAALNQHLYKVTSSEYPLSFYYHWTNYHLARFQHIAAAKAVTMGHIKKGDLSDSYCTVPDSQIITEFERIAGAYLTKAKDLRLQNNILTKLRETLLPKLISGELSLDDVELVTQQGAA